MATTSAVLPVAPPLLGQDNDGILRGVLGMDDARIRALAARAAFGPVS